MEHVNLRQAEIALQYVSGSDFEQFFHAFYPAVAGVEFVPLGGHHDGGADAFLEEALFEGQKAKPGTFYQASTQEDHRAKIRQTVKRLKQSGRDPKRLHYFTSRTVTLLDQEEELLSDELDVDIRIRDRKWIVANIERSAQSAAAYRTYLSPYVAFLSGVGGAHTVGASARIPARAMCVFLGQEIDRRRGKTGLLEAVTDSLILWALEGTDPDKKIFMTRDEILAKIEAALPSAKQFIRGEFDNRIKKLSQKGNASEREVRWYRKEDKFCLPFETRKIVELENTEDEFLKIRVLEIYKQRAAERLPEGTSLTSEQIANIAHRTLELTFEKEGLELAAFLSGPADENHYLTIADQVDEAVQELALAGDVAILAKEIVLAVLREAFYRSEEDERIYYGKLSRTYTLLFTLRNEPRIVEYFRGMSADFVLYVGSDVLVRALSERYVSPEDQMTVNMLKILREAGSTLLLTEMVVDEVQAHIAATDYEFQNWFKDVERSITAEIARHSSKILIRSYFYAKSDPRVHHPPQNWSAFVEQICSYKDLHNTQKSREQVRIYLIEKFGLEYVSAEDVAQLIDGKEVISLTERIAKVRSVEKAREEKSENVLAANDARLILAVYGKRRQLKEGHRPNPYGYRTWWLTHETKVRKATAELVKKHNAHYIIRPEFILNFVALSPSADEVRKSYDTVFPSLLGVRLSNRMREDVFHDVLRRVKEAHDIDEARAKAMLAEMSSRLKSDSYKRYEMDFDAGQREGR